MRGSKNCHGFVLLESLVAMSLILGSWMALVGVYQRLALNLTQQENKRLQLVREFDAYEVQECFRANLNIPSKGISHDPSRVFRRNRAMRADIKPAHKDKRRFVH